MTKPEAQIGMEDKFVQNQELEDLLEKRESLKEGASAYREADKAAKGAITAEPTEPPYRVGRFMIRKTPRQPREVNFEISAGTTIKISRSDE